MSNVEFLQSYPAFAPFMDVGITAEKYTDGHTITASTNWKWSVASNEIRELAAEVAAFAEIKPCHLLVFMFIPSKKRLSEAQSYLIGLSNSFFTSRSRENRCTDRVYEYPDIIRKNIGITYTRK